MQHEIYELRQMQAMPLEIKIRMTKERIEAWYDNWTRFDILNTKTGKTRFKTIDTRDKYNEPELRENEVIQSAYDGQVYVSFSGGKDSTVLKHIVDSMYDDVPSVFVNTGLEYPEIQNFAKSQKNVVTVRPSKSFKQVLDECGYPVISKEVSKCVHYARSGGQDNVHYQKLFGTHLDNDGKKSTFCCDNWSFLYDSPFLVSSRCCDIMKKSPAHHYETQTGRKRMTAMMADESRLRTQRWLLNGCNAFDSTSPNSSPMSFWTEQDVLRYIAKYNVPYCREIYGDIVRKTTNDDCDGQVTWGDVLDQPFTEDEELETTGAKRTGCVFCMFGCHLEKQPNRFQRLKKTHPQLWNYCINGGEFNEDGMWQPSRTGLGLGFVLDYIGVPYE